MQDLEIQSPRAFDHGPEEEFVHKEKQPSGAADDTSVVTSDHQQQQPPEPGSESPRQQSPDPCALQKKTQEQQQDHGAVGCNKVHSNIINDGEGDPGCSYVTVGHGVQPKKLQEQKDIADQENNKVMELEKIEISGRERLKRHRIEVAGHVWIPESWGQEECLKDWIDCSAFDSSLVPNGLMSARAALIQGGTRATSSRRFI